MQLKLYDRLAPWRPLFSPPEEYAEDAKSYATPVRRLALFIEESLYRGTEWVVFEPNDELLWEKVRLTIAAFLHNLFRQGAFAGATPKQAYFFECEK